MYAGRVRKSLLRQNEVPIRNVNRKINQSRNGHALCPAGTKENFQMRAVQLKIAPSQGMEVKIAQEHAHDGTGIEEETK